MVCEKEMAGNVLTICDHTLRHVEMMAEMASVMPRSADAWSGPKAGGDAARPVRANHWSYS